MYFFRLFHLYKNVKGPVYSMIYTGDCVYDTDVSYDLGRWSAEATSITILYYDNWNEDRDNEVGEKAHEPEGVVLLPNHVNRRQHCSEEQLEAFKAIVKAKETKGIYS